MSSPNDCPHEGCDSEVDVPPGTFDGDALTCWTCERESFMVVNTDGSWFLDTGEDDDE
jgi:hypothetical protein